MDYKKLLEQAEVVEQHIARLQEPDDLLRAYRVARLAPDIIRRAWADVAPAAGLRRFGDCREVIELQTLASADLAKMFDTNKPIDNNG